MTVLLYIFAAIGVLSLIIVGIVTAIYVDDRKAGRLADRAKDTYYQY